MPAVSMVEAHALKKKLRRAILETIASTLGDDLVPKLTNLPPGLAVGIRTELHELKKMMDNTEYTTNIHVVIDDTGIHVVDTSCEFHL